MPDSITYYRIAGLDPRTVAEQCFKRRYARVLIFDRLPLVVDHARTEDEATADFLDEWLERDYRALGYEVVRVPVLPLEERVRIVAHAISAPESGR